MKWLGKIVAILAAFSAVPAPVAAQESAPGAGSPVTLAGDVKAVKTVTDAEGVETVELVEPEVIVPGDRLVFGTDYANTGSETVSDFVVTNPVPAAVRLAPDADPDLVVSVDGGKTWGTLSELTALGEDGATRPATHADVTHVRWTIESIAPGETGRLEYPAIIR
ncbi:hypothetical protein [Erythrobacter sp.]|uniref:hypothetical protein n=1 Tax=Erythrobacter sp. TaxID=1042 RepID=UPI001425E414|nr:hypothetical protein [Erythrobacter sp.]QIQ86334.1 MAG: hypothetical protein G9473_06275 [Erythrobacter sp.]